MHEGEGLPAEDVHPPGPQETFILPATAPVSGRTSP